MSARVDDSNIGRQIYLISHTKNESKKISILVLIFTPLFFTFWLWYCARPRNLLTANSLVQLPLALAPDALRNRCFLSMMVLKSSPTKTDRD